MEVLIRNLQARECLNFLTYDVLNCYEKPKAIVLDNIRQNAILYLLLFNEYRYASYKTGDIYDFVKKKTGIEFSSFVCEGGGVEDIANHLLSQQKVAIFTVNLMYEYARPVENRGNHLHWFILKGYDCETDEYIVIDEDQSKKYYESLTASAQLKYCERRVKRSQFVKMCVSINECRARNFLKTGTFEFETVDCDYFGLECNVENIKNSFLELINSVNNKLNQHKEGIKSGIIDLLEKGWEADFKYLVYENYGAPTKVMGLWQRAISLKIYKIVFEHFVRPEQKAAFEKYVKPKLSLALNAYNICKNIYWKCYISESVQECSRIMPRLDDLISKERNFYEVLINNIDKLLV